MFRVVRTRGKEENEIKLREQFRRSLKTKSQKHNAIKIKTEVIGTEMFPIHI